MHDLVITGIFWDMEAWREKPIFVVYVSIMLTRIVSGCRKITYFNTKLQIDEIWCFTDPRVWRYAVIVR